MGEAAVQQWRACAADMMPGDDREFGNAYQVVWRDTEAEADEDKAALEADPVEWDDTWVETRGPLAVAYAAYGAPIRVGER